MGSAIGTESVTRRRSPGRAIVARAAVLCGVFVLAGPVAASSAAAVEPARGLSTVSVVAAPSVSELKTAVVQDDDSYVPSTLPTTTFAPTTTVPAEVAGETTIPSGSNARRSSGGNLARTGGNLALLSLGSVLAVTGLILAMAGRRQVGLR